MTGSWREVPLGEVITLQRGFDLPAQDRKPGRGPIVSSSGITDYHSEVGVPGPGVVTGRYGTIGQVFLIKEDYWPLNTTLWVKDFHGNDPKFASYLLRTVDFRSCSDKSSVPGVNRNDLHRIPVLLPPFSEQRAIAHILGTLDDKIELNRKMNQTLEAMARAIFKSWFVDFDPVRAKIENRDPGLPADLAALVPDSFEDSELGEIPKGWRVGTLGAIATHPRRGIQPEKIEPSTPYIALEHMPRRCIALGDWGFSDGLESNKFEFKRGEILFGKLRPYFHKVGVAPLDGVCSTDIVVVTPQNEEWFGFVLGHVSSADFVEYANSGSTGTKMPRTSWDEMARYQVVMPSEPIVAAFTARIRAIVEKIIANIHEARTLAAARKTLLPKLLSGEVRVKYAKRVMGEA
jgi:type I restriction enzyme S subunit